MKTLIIGLGNPILGDDGVGWRVVEQVQSKIGNWKSEIESDCVSLGGLSLMERMVGFQRAIIIDSMETGQSPVGSVRVFALEDMSNPSAGHSASAHDTSLLTALETGRKMGLVLPETVMVVAIEAENVYDFSEELSQPVAEAVPVAVHAVMDLLSKKYDWSLFCNVEQVKKA